MSKVRPGVLTSRSGSVVSLTSGSSGGGGAVAVVVARDEALLLRTPSGSDGDGSPRAPFAAAAGPGGPRHGGSSGGSFSSVPRLNGSARSMELLERGFLPRPPRQGGNKQC